MVFRKTTQRHALAVLQCVVKGQAVAPESGWLGILCLNANQSQVHNRCTTGTGSHYAKAVWREFNSFTPGIIAKAPLDSHIHTPLMLDLVCITRLKHFSSFGK